MHLTAAEEGPSSQPTPLQQTCVGFNSRSRASWVWVGRVPQLECSRSSISVFSAASCRKITSSVFFDSRSFSVSPTHAITCARERPPAWFSVHTQHSWFRESACSRTTFGTKAGPKHVFLKGRAAGAQSVTIRELLEASELETGQRLSAQMNQGGCRGGRAAAR